MSRKVLVKNRAPAPIQITAEQILREANDRVVQEDKAPRTHITDPEELREYRVTKRKEFEDQIRRQRQHLGTYMKYAAWEESQNEFERARSVYERTLDVDYRNTTVWLKYADMEMKHKFVNHARNVWDRAVTLHPRVDQLWYKYSYMEEMLGNITAARQVFERWMEWEPDDHGWTAYVKFEVRQQETQRARAVYERYIACHPTQRAFLKYSKWEERSQFQPTLARVIYERALQELPEAEKGERLFVAFAHFEERHKEYERARVIYKYALDNLSREKIPDLYSQFVAFEKKHGDRAAIEDVVVSKRRGQYEEALSQDPLDYDTWFDYTRLEESQGHVSSSSLSSIREVYERAIANLPPVAEKRFWRRYIFLWIKYALFEELQAGEVERAREVYRACLAVIPHKLFTFAKIWVMAAHLEVRRKDLPAARKLLGQAIGRCPGKESLFKAYIQLELQLGEVERCRTLYAKYLEAAPHNCQAWMDFAGLERGVGEKERGRAVLELAISQPALDMPERLWKYYIDFEMEEEKEKEEAEAEEEGEGEGGREGGRVRALFERLLERTKHVKVWISYGLYEGGREGGMEGARAVFQRGYAHLKEQELKEERLLLLDAWRVLEKEKGDRDSLAAVEAKVPQKLKKKRMVVGEDGREEGWEEYYDYAFPDDEVRPSGLAILQKAQAWKEAMAKAKAKKGGKEGGGGGVFGGEMEGEGGGGKGSRGGEGGAGEKRKRGEAKEEEEEEDMVEDER